jgi:hypothetical protein
MRYTRPLLVLLLMGVIFAARVQAAAIYVSPGIQSYTVGQTASITIMVSSADKHMNAVSGTVSVPSEHLTLTGISKNGSIINYWVKDPSISGSSVGYEGVSFNPGYQGSAGRLFTISLRATKEGRGRITLPQGTVLANDGQGTNITDNLYGAEYEVKAAPPTSTPVDTPTPAPDTPTPEPSAEVAAPTDSPTPTPVPVIQLGPNITIRFDEIKPYLIVIITLQLVTIGVLAWIALILRRIARKRHAAKTHPKAKPT